MAGHSEIKLRDPGPVGFPKPLKTALFACIGIGAILWLVSFGLVGDLGELRPVKTWKALLAAYCYFMMLGLGGMVFTCIQYAASARWSIAVRRISEGMAAYIPISAVFFLLLVTVGWPYLYDTSADSIRQIVGKEGVKLGADKALFLSQPVVIIKGLLFYAFWFWLANKIRKNSIAQKDSPDPKGLFRKNVKLSIGFLIPFAYLFSIHCIDLLMALEPKFFSTMFGVYCFSGLLLSTFCVIALIALLMRQVNPTVREMIGHRQLYDLGSWTMAFSCFMMYIGFSQYMLIWYANIPEETVYMIERTEGGWEYVLAILPLLKWIIPFFVLMPQGFRGHPLILILVAFFVLAGQWIDMYWMIYPVFFETPAQAIPGIAELGAFLALLGIFGVVIDRVYSKYSVLPMGDPYLQMSVDGSYL